MNRELKFRVWDKLSRYFYIDEDYQGHYTIDLKGRFHNLQNGVGGDEVIIQQYTGLKDKNGKDIYEGDILKCIDLGDWFDNQKDAVYYNNFVTFNHGAFRTNTKKGVEHGYLGTELSYHISNGTEVIGNIFENQELLN